MDQHKLLGHRGALLLIGDALRKKAEPGRQESETCPRGGLSHRLATAAPGRDVGR